MWLTITNKDGLLRQLGADRFFDGVPLDDGSWEPANLRHDEIAMLWGSLAPVPGDLPQVIVVGDGELRSFLAWTSTYLDGFRPFTSLCRVVDVRTFRLFRRLELTSSFNPVRSACAAVILADALTQGLGRIDESSVSVASCLSTYSFVRSRLIAIGLEANREYVSEIERKWDLVRDIAKQPRRRLSAQASEAPMAVLHAIAQASAADRYEGPIDEIERLCMGFMRTGAFSHQYLSKAVSIDLSRIEELMSESREQRVRVLDAILRDSVFSRISGLRGDMIRGYITSLLSPGTVEYLSYAATYLDQHPTLLLWYALFAGLHPETRVLSQFGGLCRRVLKDVERNEPLVERPRCDIAIDELEILASSGPGALAYVRQGSTFRVEFVPTISAPIRVLGVAGQSSLFDYSANQQDPTDEFNQSIDASKITADIAAAMRLLGDVHARLRGVVPQAPGDKRRQNKRK